MNKLIADLNAPMLDEHVKTVCKIGQGAACCRYLTAGGGGFSCAKFTSLREGPDERAKDKKMNALGDNCGGMLQMILDRKGELVGKMVTYRESMPSYSSSGPLKDIKLENDRVAFTLGEDDWQTQTLSATSLDIRVSGNSIEFSIAGLGSLAGIVTIALG